MSDHPLKEIPDPMEPNKPRPTSATASMGVAYHPDLEVAVTNQACLVTALKACLALVEFADASQSPFAAKAELLDEAIVHARKAKNLARELK